MAREGFRMILCFFVAFLLCCSPSSSDSDVTFLLEFKKGIQVDPLGKVLNSWDTSRGPNPCLGSWVGVLCDDTREHVLTIALNGLGLAGELKFHTLTGLSMLRNLTLSGNNFTGRIEPTFGSMFSLQYLDLSDNSFYGPIPGKFNDLYSLNYLNLSMNGFFGGYPNGLSNLQQLKVFDLRGNDLHGDVGVLFQQLRNVEHVDLSSNHFYGSIDIGVSNASSLANTAKYLNLSRNNVSGGFFDGETLQMFRNLEVLDFGNNSIRGQLPSFNSLPNLKILKLGNNMLFGSMPKELFETISPLVELDLSGNGFTGSIPPTVSSITLKILNLSSNQIYGSLPSTLKSCTTVDLSRNMIKDDISTLETWEASLDYLDLSSNKLSGSIPNLTSQYQSLTTLKISNNSLGGILPSLTGSYQKLSVVDLSSNKLQGTIPAGFFVSTLTFLNLSGNQLIGPIPVQSGHVSELLVMPTSMLMEYLDLSGNSLSGPLPGAIGDMGGLNLLNLAGNKLSGQIPAELGKLGNLEYLDFSENDFSGTIPNNLPQSLTVFNVSQNNLEGPVPRNLEKFPPSSFKPGNSKLILPNPDYPLSNGSGHGNPPGSRSHGSKGGIVAAIVVASVVAIVMIVFTFFVYQRSQQKDFHGSSSARDIKLGSAGPSLLNIHSTEPPPQTSLSFSNDHLLTSNSRSLSGQAEFASEIEHVAPDVVPTATTSGKTDSFEVNPATSGRKSLLDSAPSSSPRFSEGYERPLRLDVASPDRLAGELTFLDSSLSFTAEELSRAPAEVLGRRSHGTLYKATLDSGHMLTVKWLRVGLVRHKKDFAKELKKIGSLRNPYIVPLHAYYWGPREQERLLLAKYIQGDSLALHLYETTPRRHPPLSLNQRLNVAIDVTLGLSFLHEKGICHGNLKPSNILLTSSNYRALLTDYSLHRLMMPAGIAEQILNLGALGYRAPELEDTAKPVLTTRSDVYSFGVILMELLTRRSASDIVFGEAGVVNLTSWVRLCHQEGRGMACIDRDIASGEEHSGAMDELLALSLRCILPANERPDIRQVFADLSSFNFLFR